MLFAEVLTHPAGTLIRRESWPLHWWMTIDPDGRRLAYTSIVGGGPFGVDVMEGQTVFYSMAPVDDVLATDWVVIAEPPIQRTKLDQASYAIYESGKLLPITDMPERADGYRTITVLVCDRPTK